MLGVGYDTSMNKHNQNGSVHVFAISLLIVALVGALGWIFWQNFLQPKPAQQPVNSTDSSQRLSSSPKPQPEMQILSDWNVQFVVPDDLKQAKLEVIKETGNAILEDGSKGIYVNYYATTSRQRALGQLTPDNFDKLCEAGSGVAIMRDTAPEDEMIDRQLNTKPINGFYYRWSIPSAGGCEGPDTKAIVAALKSLEATK